MSQFLARLWDFVHSEIIFGPPGIDVRRPNIINLQAQLPIVEGVEGVATLTIHNMAASGLKSPTVPPGQIFETLSYFVRQSSRALWAKLNEVNYNKAVHGPPGTGKSRIVFAYGMTQRGLPVLYLHTGVNDYSIISKTSNMVTSPDVDSVPADHWRIYRHVFPQFGFRSAQSVPYEDTRPCLCASVSGHHFEGGGHLGTCDCAGAEE